ncbi:hypothetical protein BH09VER1_BH09VER1_14080 [soil metagenome]
MNDVTYRQIARLAGVSVAAVSLALRNRPGVSAATRQRIRDIVAQTGYRPNPLVTALMTRHRVHGTRRIRAIIALLTHENLDPSRALHSTPIEFEEGARRACEEMGFALEVFWWKDFKENARRLFSTLRARSSPGVIFHGGEVPSWCRDGWDTFALAAVGNRRRNVSSDFACADHYGNIISALHELSRRGYRRCGLAMASALMEGQNYRYVSAYHGWHIQAGRRSLPPFLWKSWDPAGFRRWIRNYRPEVVIAEHHAPLEELRKMGCQIPGEIGFVHLSIEGHWEGFAGIRQNNIEAGAAAAHIVIDRINHNTYGPPQHPRAILVEGEWISGNSIRDNGDNYIVPR